MCWPSSGGSPAVRVDGPRPKPRAKGSLALLAIVAAEVLLQIAEWQDSVADWLALQSQREQGACADPCSADVEATGFRRFDAECGVWRLVDDRWQAGNNGGLQPPSRPTAGLTPYRPMSARGPECLGEAPGAERQSCVEEVSCGPGQNGVFKEGRCDEKVSKLYEKRYRAWQQKFNSLEDGGSAARVVDLVWGAK